MTSHDPLTGPPGHEPAVEFLQSIHQNQSVDAVSIIALAVCHTYTTLAC